MPGELFIPTWLNPPIRDPTQLHTLPETPSVGLLYCWTRVIYQKS